MISAQVLLRVLGRPAVRDPRFGWLDSRKEPKGLRLHDVCPTSVCRHSRRQSQPGHQLQVQRERPKRRPEKRSVPFRDSHDSILRMDVLGEQQEGRPWKVGDVSQGESGSCDVKEKKKKNFFKKKKKKKFFWKSNQNEGPSVSLQVITGLCGSGSEPDCDNENYVDCARNTWGAIKCATVDGGWAIKNDGTVRYGEQKEMTDCSGGSPHFGKGINRVPCGGFCFSDENEKMAADGITALRAVKLNIAPPGHMPHRGQRHVPHVRKATFPPADNQNVRLSASPCSVSGAFVLGRHPQ